MHVASVFIMFSFYILLQSLITGTAVVAGAFRIIDALLGLPGFLISVRRRSLSFLASTDISLQGAFSTNDYTTFYYFK